MPTETFANLRPEKREHFLDTALAEFARHDYHSASVSRIVAELGIAKGSVYQYFTDKRDLYFHLIDRAVTAKLDYIQDAVDAAGAEPKGFFGTYRRIVHAGTDFDFRFPRYSLLITRAMQEPESSELGNPAGDLTSRSSQFLRDFVEIAVQKRELRQDVDPGLIVHMVNTMTISIGRYVEDKYAFDLMEQLESPERPLPFTPEQLAEDVDNVIEVLRRGLEA
ncbi:MAG: TetR/AcrR family transcriptional regulator [Spirochaetaceae bacterium]